MLTKILVPLDGSPLAEAALPFATAIAGRTGAHLALIRAAHYSALLGDVAGDQYRAITDAEKYLARLSARFDAQRLHVESGVPFGGSTAEWIAEESDFRQVDLVIMATHARTGTDRWVHGSVAEAVVHRVTLPVMLVHPAEAEQMAQRFTAEQPSIIVPLDGSELAAAALPVALDLAHSFGGRIIVVGVVPEPGQLVAMEGIGMTTYVEGDPAVLEATTRAYLEPLLARVRADGVPAEMAIRYGDAAAGIADVVAQTAPAAVVMATHGRKGFTRTVLGSVAGGVLHRTSVPVVLVHPLAAQRTSRRSASESSVGEPVLAATR